MIFATFIGYLGGGPLGALIITVGIFLPAFVFTLIGYKYAVFMLYWWKAKIVVAIVMVGAGALGTLLFR